MKDYYNTLGLKQDASQDDIKRAFKTLARQYHPDINKGEGTEEKFKEVSEAYETLSDDSKRSRYDAERLYKNKASSNNLYEQMFNKSFNRRPGYNFRFGRDATDFDDYFDQAFGSAPKIVIAIPIKTAFVGGQVVVHGIDNGAVTVNVPAKTAPGTILKVNSRKFGNTSIQINVEPSNGFYFRGQDLETSTNINIGQAVLGCKIKVKDPSDAEFILTIPPGTSHGTLFSLKGQGLGNGSLFIKVNVDIPKKLNTEELDAFETFLKKANIVL